MKFRLAGLHSDVAGRLGPFLDEVFALPGDPPRSAVLFGSALTSDYVPRRSDVNTLLYRDRLERDYLEALFQLSTRWYRKRLAPPLLLTPDYLRGALDATPIEIHELQLNYRCLYGEDFLAGIRLDRSHLRVHCEQQLRRLYLHLQQRYIRAGGDPTELRELLRTSLIGYVAVFRTLLALLNAPLPAGRNETILALGTRLALDVSPLQAVADLRGRGVKVDIEELKAVYLGFYEFVGEIMHSVDRMEVDGPFPERWQGVDR